jgi:hypothetical protein
MPRSCPTAAQQDEARAWLASALRFERMLLGLRAAGDERIPVLTRPMARADHERPAAA